MQTWVLSFPKSGRTWHRIMLGAYLAALTGADIREAIEPARICKTYGLPVVDYDHNGANFLDDWAPDDQRVADPALWAGRRVICITRCLADMLTSAWHHARYRAESFDGDISAFIRDPRRGAEKALTAWKRWSDHRQRAASWMHLTYEQMHENAAVALQRTVEFAGFGPARKDLIDYAVVFAEANRMRDYEQRNFFESGRLISKGANLKKGAKVRTAAIGDHRNHMSVEDITFINAMKTRFGSPF